MEKLLWVLILSFSVFFLGCGDDEGGDANDVSVEDVKGEAAETMETAGKWLGQQKDEVVSKASAKLESIRSNIEDLKTTAEAEGQELKADLQGAYENAKARFQELKEAGSESFAGAQESFSAALQELQQAYEQAKLNIETHLEKLDANSLDVNLPDSNVI